MSIAQWIGIISGTIGILGALYAFGTKIAVPFLRRQIFEPLDPMQPVSKDRLEYKDVPQAIALLAEKLHPKHPDLILAFDRGGSIVGGILAKRLGLPIRTMHREDRSNQGIVHNFEAGEIDGKVVVLVDDASRTGRSLERAVAHIQERFDPAELLIAALLVTKTQYQRHKGTTASGIVDCHAYYTTRTDVQLPWDVTA